MRHPFQALPGRCKRRGLLGLSIACLVVMATLTWAGRPLVNAAAPRGVVSFELAGDGPGAAKVLASWDARTRLLAAFGLGLDYLFLLLYAAWIALACGMLAEGLASDAPRLAAAGVAIAWLQPVAAALDAAENAALLQVLLGGAIERAPELAWLCASAKFSLVAAGLLYVLGAAAVSVLRRRGHREPAG